MEGRGQPLAVRGDEPGRLSAREAACVRLAHGRRIELLEARLREPSPIRFENPLTEPARIQWRDTTRGRVLQILMLPVVAILTVVLVLLAPLSYVADYRSRWKERRQMRAEISRLRSGGEPVPEIEYKTVETLWHACGVRDMELSHEAELELLGQ